MTQSNDAAGGREWNPYEIATPLKREAPIELPASPVRPAVPPLPPGPGPMASVVGEPELAGLGRRFVAAMIDAALYSLPLLLMLPALKRAVRLSAMGLPTGMVLSMSGVGSKLTLAYLLWAALGLWNVVWLVQRGQTVGKYFCGVRIVRPDGSLPSAFRLLVLRAALFSLAYWILLEISVWAAAAFTLLNALMVFGATRRCLHDRIADTLVVDARP